MKKKKKIIRVNYINIDTREHVVIDKWQFTRFDKQYFIYIYII